MAVLDNPGQRSSKPLRKRKVVRRKPPAPPARLQAQVDRELRKARRGDGPKVDTGQITTPAERRTVKRDQERKAKLRRENTAPRKVLRTASDIGRISAALSPVNPGNLANKTLKNLTQATYEEPTKVLKGTGKGAKDAASGLVTGIIAAATDPIGTVKQTAKDYERRYGPLVSGGAKGEREFRERIKKEGAFGELADATIIAAGPGAAGGRIAANTARKGALGPKPKAAVTEPRRKLRTTAEPAKEQRQAPTLVKAVREKRRDEAAMRGQRRVLERADADRPKTAPKTAPKGPVRAEVRAATEAGEVVPSRPVGPRVYRTQTGARRVELARAPSHRKLNKAQRADFATRKGRALHAQRREQQVEIGGAKRNLSGLNKHEMAAFKTAVQLGARTPAAARKLVAARIALIERERAAGAQERVLDTDELPTLRRLLAEPEAAFTAKLAEVADVERDRARRVAVTDPGIDATQQATLRVTAPQAEVLGTQRQGTPIKQAQATAKQRVRSAKQQRAAAGRRVETATRRAAREQGRAQILTTQQTSKGKQTAKLLDRQADALADQAARLRKTARANMMGVRATNPLKDIGPLTKGQRRYRHKARRTGIQAQGVKLGSQKYNTGKRQERRATEMEARVLTLRAEAAALRDAKAPDQTRPVPTLRRLEKSQAALLEAELARKTAKGTVKTAKKAQRTLKTAANRGQQLVDAEPVPAYVARTAAAAKREGGVEPGYFPSRKRATIRFSPFATGGPKAAATDKRYSGKLFREGREDNSQTTYLQGIAQNIKRKYNWNLVADTFDKHSFDWSRDKTIGQLEDEMARRGIDPGTVALWNPGRYREAREDHMRAEEEIDSSFAGDEPVAAGVTNAVDRATSSLSTVPADFRGTGGWSLVPKALHDEVHADTRPSGPYARSLDVVKGKQARVMLGLSPAWLQFQVVSNGLLAGLSGTGPVDMLKANLVWWKNLDDKQKAAVEPYVGVGAFADSYEQTRLGASTNNRFVDSYRAFKANDFWHRARVRGKSVRDLNPLDVLFRIDNAQNNFFRRAVLYNAVKRDAYKQMGGRMSAIQQSQDGIMPILKLGPRDQMNAIIDNPDAMETHAQHVNDFMGNYMTYTAKERRFLQRNVMFYGFLRHSLHLTFHTMPRNHPVLMAIVGQLGRMQSEEVRALLGGDELPWAMGKLYYTEDGQLRSVDLTRANPALNSITGMRTPSQLAGLVPPLFSSIAEQLFHTSAFKDKDWKIRGETQPRPGSEIPVGDRARIFIESMLGTAAPYRSLKKATAVGPEGEDSSLLLGRRPTEYKRADIVQGIQRDLARRPESATERLLLEFLPFLPRNSYDPEAARSIRIRKGEQKGAGTSTGKVRSILDGGGAGSGFVSTPSGGSGFVE